MEDINKFKTKLKTISKDTENNIIVCDCNNEFINFDKLVKSKQRLKYTLKSPDMLIISNDKKEIWFVEFKSNPKKYLGEKVSKAKIEIILKFLEGLISFYEIFQNFYEYKKVFIVVFHYRNQREKLIRHIQNLSFKEVFKYELEGKIADEVYIKDCDKLKKLLKIRLEINLDCQ
jgi:hypothetical protein